MFDFFNKTIPFLGILITLNAFSQNVGLSPYSKTELGDLNRDTGTRDGDMGFSGTGSYSPYSFSTANPAYLHNRVFPLVPSNTFYDFSLVGKASNFTSNVGKDQSFGANINRIGILIPMTKNRNTIHKWGTAFVARPFSSINYDISGTKQVAGDTLTYDYSNSGRGGLTEIMWGNGVKLSKNLMVGLNSSYVFGKYIKNNSTKLEGSSNTYSYSDENRQTYLIFKPGIAFVKNIMKADSVTAVGKRVDSLIGKYVNYTYKKLDTIPTYNFINIGMTYEYGKALTHSSYSTKKVYDANLSEYIIDTLNLSNLKNYNLPGNFKVGGSFVTLDEDFILPKMTYSFDIGYRQWALYNPNLNYRNTLSVGAGVERKKVYTKTIAYLRCGAYYNQLPYKFNNQFINELGITFGTTFKMPLPKKQQNSSVNDKMLVNASINLGQRGTSKNDLIAEKFIRFTLGFTFIEDFWFRKYKLD